MANEVGRAYVTLLPSMKQFGPQVKREISGKVSGPAKTEGEKAGKAMSGGMLPSLRSILAIVGAIGIAHVFTNLIDEARVSAKTTRLTEQALRSTGGAAKVTAGHIQAYADKIMLATGVDEDLIRQGSNMLLMFTNVRNEVGKGNDIFDRATQAAVDMSARLGVDVPTAAKVLGKALQDPVKGMTQLRRVGIILSQTQQDQIKTFMKHGDTLKAQGVIMEQVGKQFGGAAEAAADPIQRLGTYVHETAKQFVGLLLPAMEGAATFITTKMIPYVQNLFDTFKTKGAGVAWDKLFGDTSKAVSGINTWVQNVFRPWVAQATSTLWNGFKTWFSNSFMPWITEKGPELLGKLGEWTTKFITWVGDMGTKLLKAFNDWLTNTFIPDMTKQSTLDSFGAAGGKLGGAIGSGFKAALPGILKAWAEMGAALVVAISQIEPAINRWFQRMGIEAGNWVNWAIPIMKTAVAMYASQLIWSLVQGFAALPQVFSNAARVFTDWLPGVFNTMSSWWSQIWNVIPETLGAAIQAAINLWNSVPIPGWPKIDGGSVPFIPPKGGFGGGQIPLPPHRTGKPAPPMATGGMVMAEGEYRLAEQGKKEAVVPLEDPRAIAALRKALGGGRGDTWNVYSLSPQAIADAVARTQRQQALLYR